MASDKEPAADKAIKRVTKEYKKLTNTPVAFASVAADSANILHWTVTLAGPSDTAYAKGKFKIDVTFPATYPMNPPKVHGSTVCLPALVFFLINHITSAVCPAACRFCSSPRSFIQTLTARVRSATKS